MAAGDDQHERRELRLLLAVQPGGVDVPFEVVDRDERLVVGEGQRLGEVPADQQRAGQPRPERRGHGVDLAHRAAGLRQRFVEHRDDRADVLAGRQLGDDAAVRGVHLDLRSDDAGEQVTPVFDDADGGLVAGGLDAEDLHAGSSSGAAATRTAPQFCWPCAFS